MPTESCTDNGFVFDVLTYSLSDEKDGTLKAARFAGVMTLNILLCPCTLESNQMTSVLTMMILFYTVRDGAEDRVG